ncbi:MAG TPA: protein kinase [Polyangiaceae bacterium]|nr:protein kinase [Polyangiaceae bacterium]
MLLHALTMANGVMLEPGEVFAGRYKIIRLIAPGGMGAVFEARHLGTERHVALKLLWPHVLAVDSAREKFELEAKVAARVQSDHIVHVFDAGFDTESHTPYLVMELLSGGTLSALVQREGPQSATATLHLLEQVARGLDAAHGLVDERGRPAPIIHRDLKPENLLLCTRPGDTKVIKILDFGIAKVLSESRNMSHEIRGTPLYMAYEQVVAEPLSPQTDVWALGLIAYFLLTGQLFWRSAADPDAGIQALFAEIVALPIPSARVRMREQRLTLDLPDAFDAWLARCLDRAPSRRFESAGATINALDTALRGGAGSRSSSKRSTLLEPQPRPASRSERAAASPGRGAARDERPSFGRRTARWAGGIDTGSAAPASLGTGGSIGYGSMPSLPALERRLVPVASRWSERRRLLLVGGLVGVASLLGVGALLLRLSGSPGAAGESGGPAAAAVEPGAAPVPEPATAPPPRRPAATVAPIGADPIGVHPVTPEAELAGGALEPSSGESPAGEAEARDPRPSPAPVERRSPDSATRSPAPARPAGAGERAAGAPAAVHSPTSAPAARRPVAPTASPSAAAPAPAPSKPPPRAIVPVDPPKPPQKPAETQAPINPFDVR